MHQAGFRRRRRLLNLLMAASLAGILLLLSACAGAVYEQGQQARTGEARLFVKPQDEVPGAALLSGLPGLSELRAPSSVLDLNQAGNEAVMRSPFTSASSGDLELAASPGQSSYAVFAFHTQGRAYSGLEAVLSDLSASRVWVALADFDAGRWQILGSHTDSFSMPLSGSQWLDPMGVVFVALIASDAPASVEQLALVVSGADATNTWPVNSVHRQWLKDWYLPLPLMSSPSAVYQDEQLQAYADEVFNLLNQYRASKSLAPLLRSPHLDALANAHCRDMAAREYFEHDNLEGMDPEARMEAMDCPEWLLWAENIAVGYPGPAEVTQGWIDSTGHRTNMELEDAEYVGIGVWRNVQGTIFWSHNFASFFSDPVAHDWIEPGEEQP
ncbi:CAP domain-containing protein [bacterium]|nr:CAP domain-containing protein [bacterium]